MGGGIRVAAFVESRKDFARRVRREKAVRPEGKDEGMSRKHVAVLMGGFSSERPVSLSSGNSCADALEKAGYRVTRVDVSRDVASVLGELKPDVAFNALHGPFGEDGTIQGVLEYLGIP